MSDAGETTMLDELLEAWRTNQEINLFLLDAIPAAAMKTTLSKRGGRDVAAQFAHIHNVRVWHLENRAKDLAEGLEKFATKTSPTKAELRKALKASSARLEEFFAAVVAGEPKRRGFKRGVFSMLGYFVSHESHHRGSILLTIKTCGHRLDNEKSYAIWGMWDRAQR